ncbi:hypothetical protein BH23VER1_BH23VER1_30090 [soil metagenome]
MCGVRAATSGGMILGLSRAVLACVAVGLPVVAAAKSSVTDPESTARAYLAAPGGGAEPALDPVLRSVHLSASNGVTHLVFAQTVAGVPIHHGDILVNIGSDGSIINVHGTFGGIVPAAAAMARSARLSPAAIRSRAVEMVGFIAGEPLPAAAVWFRQPSGTLVRATRVTARLAAGGHVYELVIDTATGDALSRARLTHDVGSYLVAPLPLTDPDEGARRLVTGMPDPVASPFGWHDTNGMPGPDSTETRGNNVFAQEDADMDNLFGFRPSGGTSLVFDFPPGPTPGSVTERDSGLVSLFYTTNVCHDLFYSYGFTEAAGNFQQNNYGRGGAQGDALRADSEDPAAAGNAQFFSPLDGTPPRMELGTRIRPSTLTVTAPPEAAGGVPARTSSFGGRTDPAGITAEIVAAIDAADAAGPSTTDCCSPPLNAAALVGNIALIDRGTCDFDVKLRHAQEAGAIGVIVANNAGDGLVTMAGDDPAVTIPAVFVGQTDGADLRAALGAPLVATAVVPPDLNFADDATIVVHEYGHGVTSRLTGGRFNTSCLSGLVSGGLGEGWSDLFALAFTTQATDTRITPRRIGTYAFGPFGLRTFPYTSNRTANPLTYRDVASRIDVHGIGEVWCAALWDLHWDLIGHYGFSADLSAPWDAGGNTLALQLVIDALQLQPCSPSFLDARDAVILADQLLTGGTNQFGIWNAFARRGLGEAATEGSPDEPNAVSEDFGVPPALDLADDDLDGSPNLIEIALGSDYLDPSSVAAPQAATTTIAGSAFPTLRYQRQAGGMSTTAGGYSVAGLSYTVEAATDLTAFAAAPLVTVATTPGTIPGYETVTVRTTTPVTAATPPQFLRLRITRRADETDA